ncbi:hypothetical protein D3C85_1813210 [compost metagenome]
MKIKTAPRSAVMVPRVTIKALIPMNCTIDPFSKPAQTATVIEKAQAGQKPN